MGTTSNGRPDEPVFVDSSGGRSRRWRRLGWIMGAAGGGYALVLAVSVIGGNSDAPWVLIPGTDRDSSGSVRVVPERTDDTDNGLPAAGNGELAAGQPSASASVGNGPRTPAGSGDAATGARGASGTQSKVTQSGGSGGKKGGGSKGQSAGTPPATGNPGTVPSQPDPPTSGPSDEPTPDETTTEPSEGGGLLEDILGGLGGIGGAGTK